MQSVRFARYAKPNHINLPDHTYQTKPTKPNLPNQTKFSQPSLLNQTYQTKPKLLVKHSTPGSVVPLASYFHQFDAQGTLFQTSLVVIVGSTDLNPKGQQSTHIQLAPHGLNNTTGFSYVSVGILMRTMVVFGS